MHSKASEEPGGVKHRDGARHLIRDGHMKENTRVSQKQQREGRSGSENGLCFLSPFRGKNHSFVCLHVKICMCVCEYMGVSACFAMVVCLSAARLPSYSAGCSDPGEGVVYEGGANRIVFSCS